MLNDEKAENARVVSVFGEGGSLKASLWLGLRHVAFTMAEILLSLTIIGVVAAITLPSLTGNINERTWNTQRKALYSRLSQAVSLMDGMRGYGTVSKGVGVDAWGSEATVTSSDDAAEAFLSAGLSKVLKMNNICDYSHLGDCGLPDKFARLGGGGEKINLSDLQTIAGLNNKFAGATIDPEYGYANGCGLTELGGNLDTKAAAFETANGESILVHYNPLCRQKESAGYGASGDFYQYNPLATFCVNFVYDLNGKKGPNTVGKDMGFMTVFGPIDPMVVAPIPHAKNLSGKYSHGAAMAACRNLDDSRLPTVDELASITVNKTIMDEESLKSRFWSAAKSSTYYSDGAHFLAPAYDALGTTSGSSSLNARCVKRN